MGEERHGLDHLKGENPFRVPEGYMENLTDQIMSQLPEKTIQYKAAKKTSLVMRLRPWAITVAAIAGIGFFINVFIGLNDRSISLDSDSLWVQAPNISGTMSDIKASLDEEYLEYLEARYSDYILEEELADSE